MRKPKHELKHYHKSINEHKLVLLYTKSNKQKLKYKTKCKPKHKHKTKHELWRETGDFVAISSGFAGLLATKF